MTERRDDRGLAFHRWPEADRLMWGALVRPGNAINGAGPFAAMRPATRQSWQNAYGYFLGHLRLIGIDLYAEPAAERATLDRLRSFADSISGLAPLTQAGYFEGVHAVLTAAFPGHDWARLTAARRNLRRRANQAPRARCASRLVTGDVLLELGLSMLAEARDGAGPIDTRTAELWRDGLMIAFLAAHPMRIANFALLEIGTTIRKMGPGYRVAIPATASKNHRPFDFSVAPLIAGELEAYLDECRPIFPSGRSSDTGRLWLAVHGEPWRHKSAGRRISAQTERQLGIRVTPHQFRHAAATTLALIRLESVVAAIGAAGRPCRIVSATDTGFRAIDGDTLEALSTGERIRLLGVNRPELHRPGCEAELVGALIARRAVQRALDAAGTVDIRRQGTDRYARTLARVTLDGADLSAALIAAGLGRPYVPGRTGKGWCD